MYPVYPETDLTLACAQMSFANLMQIYAKNYVLAQQLLEEQVWEDSEKNEILIETGVQNYYQLQTELLKKEKWTTTFAIHYSIVQRRNHQRMIRLIDIQMRVYDDSKQAEIINPNDVLRQYLKKDKMQNDLVTKWHLNYFLFNILLLFCQQKSRLKKTPTL